jgi:NADH-quinone oxidoreductase subunit A
MLFLDVPVVHTPTYSPSDFTPLFIQLACAVGFVVFAMTLSHAVGPKRKSQIKNTAWECGIEGTGQARTPISVKYFLIAILFVLFDVEVIFMYPWAVNFRALGWAGFVEMILFMGTVLAGFYYIVKKGVLKWE